MARTHHDQLCKSILDISLAPFGDVETQREVLPEVQAIDVVFAPIDGERAPPRSHRSLGILARMTRGMCLIEPFRNAPGSREVRGCQTKHYVVEQSLARKARRARKPAKVPHLWIISTGKPLGALERLGFVSDPDWPTGFYRAHDGYSTHLVVLRELAKTPDTLLLRLLGSERVFREAYAELSALPNDTWQARELMPVLLAFVSKFHKTRSKEKDMLPFTQELLQSYQETLAKTRQAGLDEGRRAGLDEGRRAGLDTGIDKGIREALIRVYEARFGDPPASLVEVLDGQPELEVLQGWIGPFATLSADELYALVVSDDA